MAPVKMRRSFSQKQFGSKSSGPQGKALLQAFSTSEQDGYIGMHALHPYPGRFHPLCVRRLLDLHSQGEGGDAVEGRCLLDPFMGSGTTLLEGRRQGWNLLGNDLNPIAVRLTEMKLLQLSTRERIQLKRTLIDVGQFAGQHEGWVGHPHQELLRQVYRPHTLAEMLHLWAVIQELEGVEKLVAEMMLSACCVKFSTLSRDSSPQVQSKAPHPKGAVFRWWADRVRLLIPALEEEDKQRPRVQVELHCGDMLQLGERWRGQADLIITSPPYPGTYDYADHHRLRTLWLDLPVEAFEEQELGARRQSMESWHELGPAMLETMAELLRPSGVAYVVMGDWVDEDGPYEALDWLRHHGVESGLRVVNSASLVREPRFTVGRSQWEHPRWEHLVEMRRG